METMKKQTTIVNNQTGLHLRPAGILCRTAMLYKSHIALTFGSTTANAKSAARCSAFQDQRASISLYARDAKTDLKREVN